MSAFRPLSGIGLVAGLALFQASAFGAISGINTPVTSIASIQFDDTTSFDPILTPGVTNTTPTITPWSGATHSLPFTTDPITSDTAQGDVTASFAGNSYFLTFGNVTLTQLPVNTGTAHLVFTFDVEYQLDGAGLPSQATIAPSFSVSGTVQPGVGTFALISGFINLDGVNTAGTISTVETINYFQQWTTPGPFSAIVAGVPTAGTTPVLQANTTLRLWGSMVFQVDPASINAFSFVPEPSMLALGLPALLGLCRRPRR